MEYTERLHDEATRDCPDEAAVSEMSVVNRNYKDTVFRMLFQKKEDLLSLYNAVNGTSFSNVDDLEIATLENAVYLGMKNDVSFVLGFELSLYEHQSTVNPNMPLRDLFYVSRQLQKMISDESLYGSKRIYIPTPRFVVFYNGQAMMPEKKEYRLSEMFQKKMSSPELELIVTVYNINSGMNDELLEACTRLKEYMQFITMIRENSKTMELNPAVNKAVDDCIEQGILSDFLRAQRAEVVDVSITEYNQEKHMALIRREGIEQGIAQGIEQGRTEGKAESIVMILESRFGELPQELRAAIYDISDLERLDSLLKDALTVGDLQTMEENNFPGAF